MSLDNFQLQDLAKRMNIPLEFVGFKTELKCLKRKYNTGYIINSQDEFDDKGKRNPGSHWCSFIIQKNMKTGAIYPIYFDSYGAPADDDVLAFMGVIKSPHNTKDIQSLVSDVCGWYCLAWLYFCLEMCPHKNIYKDTAAFTDLFDDMETNHDHKKNEFILKQFFRSPNSETRVKYPVEVV